jgi:hypothetical protein
MLIATAKSPYVRDASKSREASISRDTRNSRKSIPAAKETNIGNIRIDKSSRGDISLLAAGMQVTDETTEQGNGKGFRVSNLTEAINGSNTHNCP